MKKWIGVSAVTMALVGAVSPTIANGSTANNAVSYGPNGVSAQTLSHEGQGPSYYLVSDEHEKEHIRKVAGDKYADRLITRATTPIAVDDLPVDLQNYQFTTSQNATWGGYSVRPAGVPKGVAGDFKVPTVTGGAIATWTGVGGDGGSTQLIQTGVASGDILSQNLAWTEALPAAPQYWFAVNNGDQMYSSVSYDSDTGKWNLLIQDITSGTYQAVQYSYSPGASAEWVIEGVGNNNIGKFTANFTNSFWNDSTGAFKKIDANTSTLFKYTLASPSGQVSNAPSSITSGSTSSSFSISR